jgi:hypothetical protein
VSVIDFLFLVNSIQYSRIWISDVKAIKPQNFDEPRVRLWRLFHTLYLSFSFADQIIQVSFALPVQIHIFSVYSIFAHGCLIRVYSVCLKPDICYPIFSLMS